MVLLQPLVLKNISPHIFEEFLFGNNFNSVAIVESRVPKRVPYRHGLSMVLLQPLLWKNISLLIFKDFLFGNNFNRVAIVDSRAPQLVPWPLYGLTTTFNFRKIYLLLFFEEFLS